MNVETTLTDELRAVAGSVQPPPAPIAELVRRAEKERTRARVTRTGAIVLVAAAVVGAVVIGTQIGRPTAAPSPTHPTQTATHSPLPTGEPLHVPYVTGGKLYVDGVVQPGSWQGVQTVGRTSVGYPDTGGGSTSLVTIVLFHDRVEVARITNAAAAQRAVVSQDGTKVAWVELDDHSAAHLVMRDMRSGHELGRLLVDRRSLSHEGEENEGWETVSEVSNAGTVTYGGVVVLHAWKPGSAPVDRSPAPNATPTPGYPRNAGEISVNAYGSWGAWHTDHDGNPDPYDDGTWRADGITVQRPGDPGTRVTITLPDGTNAGTLAWESATYLLVSVSDDLDGEITHYLRCSVLDRTCELAPFPSAIP